MSCSFVYTNTYPTHSYTLALTFAHIPSPTHPHLLLTYPPLPPSLPPPSLPLSLPPPSPSLPSPPHLPLPQALALDQQRQRARDLYARVPPHDVPALEATLLRHMPGGVIALRHALNQAPLPHLLLLPTLANPQPATRIFMLITLYPLPFPPLYSPPPLCLIAPPPPPFLRWICLDPAWSTWRNSRLCSPANSCGQG